LRTSLIPASPWMDHCGAPARPRLVVITMTPFAASVPYSVAADGPFTTSTLSISSGLMSFTRLGRLPPPVPAPPIVLVMRTPSMM
jgi:hypothetical protein